MENDRRRNADHWYLSCVILGYCDVAAGIAIGLAVILYGQFK